MSPRANNEGDICLTCGLCCSGGLFDHVDLQPGEIDPIVALGAKLYPGEPPRIAFPCALLCGKACTVYDNRPAMCRKYRCELLFRRENGGISDSEALGLIKQALHLVAAVEALLPEGQTVSDARRRLQDDPEFWRKETGAEQQRALRFVMTMAALSLHLDRHFRSEDQRLIQR